jgi:hypothetical protein
MPRLLRGDLEDEMSRIPLMTVLLVGALGCSGTTATETLPVETQQLRALTTVERGRMCVSIASVGAAAAPDAALLRASCALKSVRAFDDTSLVDPQAACETAYDACMAAASTMHGVDCADGAFERVGQWCSLTGVDVERCVSDDASVMASGGSPRFFS